MSDIIKKFSSTAIALVILIVAGAYYLVFEKGLEEKHKKESRLFSKLIKNDISSIRLTYPDSSIVLSKQAENWFLVKRGKTYKADGFTVSTIVDAVVDLKAESDVSKDDDDLAQYGLESPTVRLGATAGGDVYSVSIGAESPVGSGVYIKQEGVEGVKLSDSSLVWPFLDRKFNDLRDREIIDLDEDNITRVSFKAGNFNKTFTKEDGRWVSEGLADYIDINHLHIEGIVRSFSDLRVVGFETDEPGGLAQYGLDKPQVILKLSEGENEHEYIFGFRKGDADYFMKLGSAQSIYLVSSHNFDQLPSSIDDLRIKKLFSIKEDVVGSIKIENNDKVFILEKKNGEWSLDNNEGQVDQGKVLELVSQLARLEVKEFADDDPADLGKYGIADADISITLNGDQSSSLLIGNEKDEQVYAKKTSKDSVYLINNSILSLLPDSVGDLLLTVETDSGVVESD